MSPKGIFLPIYKFSNDLYSIISQPVTNGYQYYLYKKNKYTKRTAPKDCSSIYNLI